MGGESKIPQYDECSPHDRPSPSLLVPRRSSCFMDGSDMGPLLCARGAGGESASSRGTIMLSSRLDLAPTHWVDAVDWPGRRGVPPLTDFRQDVRYAVRHVARA